MGKVLVVLFLLACLVAISTGKSVFASLISVWEFLMVNGYIMKFIKYESKYNHIMLYLVMDNHLGISWVKKVLSIKYMHITCISICFVWIFLEFKWKNPKINHALRFFNNVLQINVSKWQEDNNINWSCF